MTMQTLKNPPVYYMLGYISIILATSNCTQQVNVGNMATSPKKTSDVVRNDPSGSHTSFKQTPRFEKTNYYSNCQLLTSIRVYRLTLIYYSCCCAFHFSCAMRDYYHHFECTSLTFVPQFYLGMKLQDNHALFHC